MAGLENLTAVNLYKRGKTMKKFNFYNAYLEEMNKLSARQFKKLVNALSVYAETGDFPERLSKKAYGIFWQIQRVISVEKDKEILSEIRRINGKKGARKRWVDSR